MKRVMLLAPGDLNDMLCKELSKTYIVLACSDQKKAEESLRSKPDALILNMALSGMDSMEFLKANAKELPPVIIAITPLINCSLLNDLEALGVSYLIRLPCELALLLDKLSEQLAKKCLS